MTQEAPWAYRFVAAVFAVAATPFARIHVLRGGATKRVRTAIVVSNHRSMFDFVMALVAFRRLGRFPRVIVASQYFDRPFSGWALRRAGAIPLDRDSPTTYYDDARAVLAAGIPILMLPEGKLSGTRGEPTSLGEFKRGAARLASECEAPVWVIAHVGTEDVWPRGRSFPRLRLSGRQDVVLLGAAEVVWMAGDEVSDTAMLEAVVRGLLLEATEIYELKRSESTRRGLGRSGTEHEARV